MLWDAPDDDQEIVSYNVNWYPEDGSVDYTENSTIAYLVDLEPCTTYNVTVTAINVNGTESEPSDEQEQDTLAEGKE